MIDIVVSPFYALFGFILTVLKVGIIIMLNLKKVKLREVEVMCQRVTELLIDRLEFSSVSVGG